MQTAPRCRRHHIDAGRGGLKGLGGLVLFFCFVPTRARVGRGSCVTGTTSCTVRVRTQHEEGGLCSGGRLTIKGGRFRRSPNFSDQILILTRHPIRLSTNWLTSFYVYWLCCLQPVLALTSICLAVGIATNYHTLLNLHPFPRR